MPWKPMRLRDQRVLARCDETGSLRADAGGRVEIRYGPKSPKAYRAGARNLSPDGASTVYPDDHCVALVEDERPSKEVKTIRTSASAVKQNESNALAVPAADTVLSSAGAAREVIAYADGACSGNPGPSGAGALIQDGAIRLELSEFLGHGTNNIGELTALLRVAEALAGESRPITIYTDSQYAIGVLTKGWKAKANPELIARVKAALTKLPRFSLRYVRGHAGDPGNERADALARLAVEAQASTPWMRVSGS